jgi:hypothetical protein
MISNENFKEKGKEKSEKVQKKRHFLEKFG